MTYSSAIGTTLRLQPIVVLYALASVLSKTASGYLPAYAGDVFAWIAGCVTSLPFVACVAGMFACLGVYAIVWQIVIKDAKIGLVYANKSSELFWMLLAAAFIFGERVTALNAVGVLMIFAGVVITNTGMSR